MRVTCNSLQNRPFFSQSVLKGAKYGRRKLYKINWAYFSHLSLYSNSFSGLTPDLSFDRSRTPSLPSTGIRQKHPKVIMDKFDRLHFLVD